MNIKSPVFMCFGGEGATSGGSSGDGNRGSSSNVSSFATSNSVDLSPDNRDDPYVRDSSGSAVRDGNGNPVMTGRGVQARTNRNNDNRDLATQTRNSPFVNPTTMASQLKPESLERIARERTYKAPTGPTQSNLIEVRKINQENYPDTGPAGNYAALSNNPTYSDIKLDIAGPYPKSSFGQVVFDQNLDLDYANDALNSVNPVMKSRRPRMRPYDLAVDPVSMNSGVGVLGNVSNAPTFATRIADYTGLERTYNTQAEETANFFTPNDGASYVRGQLVDDATGLPIEAGGMTSTDRKIGGYMDNVKNNLEGFGGLGGAPILNSSRETFANMITPGDNAAYVNGQLINTLTGESLQGGGYTIDPVTKKKDYIYGVSDDYSNNLQVDTTGMTDIEARSAIANQVMRRNIAPSDSAYFGSFIPSIISPMFGGKMGEQMLEGGIKGRNSIVDKHTAALEAGARPVYNEKNEYVGYDAGQGTVDYDLNSYERQSTLPTDQDTTRMGGDDDINDQVREARRNPKGNPEENPDVNPDAEADALAISIQKFYASQFYRDLIADDSSRRGIQDMYDSEYFGSVGSSTFGKAQDRAYEAFLAA